MPKVQSWEVSHSFLGGFRFVLAKGRTPGPAASAASEEQGVSEETGGRTQTQGPANGLRGNRVCSAHGLPMEGVAPSAVSKRELGSRLLPRVAEGWFLRESLEGGTSGTNCSKSSPFVAVTVLAEQEHAPAAVFVRRYRGFLRSRLRFAGTSRSLTPGYLPSAPLGPRIRKDPDNEEFLGLAEYDEMEGIAWKWESIEGTMAKSPPAREAVGRKPADRGKKGKQAPHSCRRAWRLAVDRRDRSQRA